MKKKNLNWLLIALAALALVFAGACSDGSDADPDTETPADGTTGGNNPSSSNPTDGTGTDDDDESGSGTCECGTTGCTGGSSCNACDDCGCDDCGTEVAVSDSLADEIKGTAWEFTGTVDTSSISDTGTYLVTVTLDFDDDGNTVTGEASWIVRSDDNGGTNTAHAGTISGTYDAVEGDATQISVTLGTGGNTQAFTLTLKEGSYSESDGVLAIELNSSSELAVGGLTGTPSFDVECDGGDTCGSDNNGECDDEADVDIFDSENTSGQIATSSAFTYKEGV